MANAGVPRAAKLAGLLSFTPERFDSGSLLPVMAVAKLYRLQSLNGFRYLIGKALFSHILICTVLCVARLLQFFNLVIYALPI